MTEETATIPAISIDVDTELARPRLEALLLCDYGSITIAGKPDICGVFDQFIVDPETKTTGFFFLYIRTVQTTEGTLDISFFDTKGHLMGTGSGELDPKRQGEQRRLNLLQRLSLEVQEEGEYWIDVSYGGESLGKTKFSVKYHTKETKDGIGTEGS